MSCLLALSMNSLIANSAESYMSKYISSATRNTLATGDFVTQYNAGLKALYLARVDAYYDMNLLSYLASFFLENEEYNIIKGINQEEQRIRERLAVLQNNTWESWGWSAIKYSTIIAATYLLTKYSDFPATI